MNDMYNGYGTLIDTNGDMYQGEWKDNKAHGMGKF